MKLATFRHDGEIGIGLAGQDEIRPLSAIEPRLPKTMEQLLAAGSDALDVLRRAEISGPGTLPLALVKLLAPIRNPRKFLGIGLNYRAHAAELKEKAASAGEAQEQIWFNKQVSCINGPYDPIHLPRVSSHLDYEGELAVVIGTRCRHVQAAEAHQVIAGYMVCNDVSVRDWQRRAPTATLGKSFDTHGPCGPWLTTADEVPEAGSLTLRTWVDGELRQQGNTADLIHKIPDMIAYLSTVFTLEPGDILATGTPSGVGAGFDPPRYLTVAQTVRVEIDGLGFIENRVVAEPPAASMTGVDYVTAH